jgi:hypothetical protein
MILWVVARFGGVIFRAMKHGCRAKAPFRIPHQRLRIEMERYDGVLLEQDLMHEFRLASNRPPTSQSSGLLNIPKSHHWIVFLPKSPARLVD